jgi:hypothetical protein
MQPIETPVAPTVSTIHPEPRPKGAVFQPNTPYEGRIIASPARLQAFQQVAHLFLLGAQIRFA